MTLVAQGARRLAETEAALKQLAGEAVEQNEWDSVRTLAEWARLLRSLVESSGIDFEEPISSDGRHRENRGTSSPAGRTSVADASDQSPRKRTQGRSEKESKERSSGRKTTNTARKKNNAKQYPRFLREKDALVKVGWSRKSKKEYEHRAPREVLDQVVAEVGRLGAKGRRFTVEDLLGALEADTGWDTPSYQTYLCVAWLRQHELIRQHGRQGYSIVSPAKMSALVKSAWASTATRD